MNETNLLLPLDRILEIARSSVKKHCKESHNDFEDFVQDVLLGILERQNEYDATLGKPETFLISIANQKACNSVTKHRRREKAISLNRSGCISFQCSPENVNELDAKGDLSCVDESIFFARFFSLLDATDSAALKLRLKGHSAKETQHILGISVSEFHKAKKNILENFKDFHFSQKNNAVRENYYW